MRRLLVPAAALLLAAAGCTGGGGDGGDGDGGGAEGDTAPQEATWSVPCEPGRTPVEPIGELSLACLGDEAETPVGVRDGRPLVIVLWASWCAPCAQEAPEVEAFFDEYGDQVDVLGVDSADTREQGRWFAEDFAMSYPSVFDPDEAVRTSLGVPALPGVAFVDADGSVVELIVEPGVTTEILVSTAESALGLESQ